MAVDAYAALKNLIDRILGGDRQVALEYAEDPYGTLAGNGVTDGDLSQVDMYQLVSQSASEHGAQQLVQSYGGGGASPAPYPVASPPAHTPHQSAHDVVQHLNYVTYATYEGDEYITQQLINQQNYDYSTNIDNSVDNSIDVSGTVHGGIESSSVTATAGGTAIDDSPIVIGSNFNTGDNVAQAFGDQHQVVAGERNQTANIDTSGGDGTGGNAGTAVSGNAQGGNALGGFGTGGDASGGHGGHGGDGDGGFAVGVGGDGGFGFLGDGGDGGDGASADGYGGAGGHGGDGGQADGIGGAASADAYSTASADGGAGVGGAGGAIGNLNISFGSQDNADEEDLSAAL